MNKIYKFSTTTRKLIQFHKRYTFFCFLFKQKKVKVGFKILSSVFSYNELFISLCNKPELNTVSKNNLFKIEF